MNLDVTFKNDFQRQFFFSRHRNNCFSGGFGNGKSYIACLKIIVMLCTIRRYRVVIARQFYKDLKATTMQTFFKICPSDFIETHSNQDGYTRLKNGSEVLWMHLDSFDEQSLRGLEINSALIDQAEEVDEGIVLILDSRVGRWDQAVVPNELVDEYEKTTGETWPRHLGKPKVPNYFDILCNPDTTFHWIYRKFHPDSFERDPDYFYVEAETDVSLNDPKTIAQMQKRDPEWVAKYMKGKWGASSAQIHVTNKECFIDATPKLLERIKTHGALFRVLDHGDAAPTCCLWVAALNGVYIFYREYYSAGQLISQHRKSITELSGDESYEADYADPSIFRKASQKDGGFWSVADEYRTLEIDAPDLVWLPADNNEFATRNRINELLLPQEKFVHPITGEKNSPGIYFIRRSSDYPHGCHNSIIQLGAQRRLLIGSDNGKALYSDDRDPAIPDHAYDPIRYFVAMHGAQPKGVKKAAPRRSFAALNRLLDKERFSAPSPNH